MPKIHVQPRLVKFSIQIEYFPGDITNTALRVGNEEDSIGNGDFKKIVLFCSQVCHQESNVQDCHCGDDDSAQKPKYLFYFKYFGRKADKNMMEVHFGGIRMLSKSQLKNI